jgi:hypothetical protein
MTHTPGPWTVEEYGDDETPALVIHRDSESRVCFMATPGSHGDPAMIEANAHLIAAAPDMLAALKSVAGATIDDLHDGCSPLWEEVEAAIAKAEGSELSSTQDQERS